MTLKYTIILQLMKLMTLVSTYINTDLAAIARYSEDNNLKLNIDKCAVICFSGRKCTEFVNQNAQIIINDKILQTHNSVKNLGLIIDND
jgi:hypothetical protein